MLQLTPYTPHTCHAQQHATSVLLPVWRQQAGKGGHKVHAAAVRHLQQVRRQRWVPQGCSLLLSPFKELMVLYLGRGNAASLAHCRRHNTAIIVLCPAAGRVQGNLHLLLEFQVGHALCHHLTPPSTAAAQGFSC